MEPINFFNNGSPKHHKAISRWFYMSCITFSTFIISLASLHFKQWYIQSTLVAEKFSISNDLHKLDHIALYVQNQKVLHANLEKKSEHLKNKNAKTPLELLKAVKTSLKSDATLEALSFNEKSVELKIASEKTNTILHCSELLSKKSPYCDLCITALESKEKSRFLGTIKTGA